MKKSVIILIAIIYAASITLVTFFGLKYSSHFTEEILVEKLEIINEGIRIDEADGSKYIILYPDEEGKRTFQVEYSITPDDAHNKDVEFSLDGDVASVDENGLVTFNQPGRQGATLHVVTTDGTRLKDSILIVFWE